MAKADWAPRLNEISAGGKGKTQWQALPIKLTDSALKALADALQGGGRGCSVEVGGEGGGRLRLGKAGDFHFQLKPLNLGEGALHILQGSASDGYRLLNQPTQRVQISATEDSFESARARTKALAEEEARKGGKEVRHRNARTHNRLNPVAKASTSASAASRPSPAGLKGPHSRPAVDYSKRSLRERLLHLLAISTLTKDQLVERLQRQDAGHVDRGEVTQFLHELASVRHLTDERSGQKLQGFTLRTDRWKEVDPKWPGYSKFDTTVVAKKQGSAVAAAAANSRPTSATIAPSSSSNRERPPTSARRVSPELQTSGGQKEAHSSSGLRASAKEPLSGGQKRKATTVASPPRSLQASSTSPPSIPDDPPQEERRRIAHSKQTPQPPPSQPPAAKKSRPSPPSDPELPHPPAKEPLDLKRLRDDWEAEFPAIHTVAERRAYKAKFEADYKEYWKCYEWLNKVAALFDNLDKQLKEAEGKEEKGREVESEIEKHYRQYVTDPKFISRQSQHQKLRQKLAVIKGRIQDFDHRLAAKAQPLAT